MRQIAVIGLGRFGSSVAVTLAGRGCEVLAIDKDPEEVEALSEFVTNAVQCDATHEKALRGAGIASVDAAVVGIGDSVEGSIMVVMTLQEIGIKEIIAKSISPLHDAILSKMGVSRIIRPERDAGERLAHSLLSPNILEYLPLSPGYSLEEISVPEKFIGQKLDEFQRQTHYRVNVIAVKKKVTHLVGKELRQEEIFNFIPSSEDLLDKGDILVVIGREEDLGKLGV